MLSDEGSGGTGEGGWSIFFFIGIREAFFYNEMLSIVWALPLNLWGAAKGDLAGR